MECVVGALGRYRHVNIGELVGDRVRERIRELDHLGGVHRLDEMMAGEIAVAEVQAELDRRPAPQPNPLHAREQRIARLAGVRHRARVWPSQITISLQTSHWMQRSPAGCGGRAPRPRPPSRARRQPRPRRAHPSPPQNLLPRMASAGTTWNRTPFGISPAARAATNPGTRCAPRAHSRVRRTARRPVRHLRPMSVAGTCWSAAPPRKDRAAARCWRAAAGVLPADPELAATDLAVRNAPQVGSDDRARDRNTSSTVSSPTLPTRCTAGNALPRVYRFLLRPVPAVRHLQLAQRIELGHVAGRIDPDADHSGALGIRPRRRAHCSVPLRSLTVMPSAPKDWASFSQSTPPS